MKEPLSHRKLPKLYKICILMISIPKLTMLRNNLLSFKLKLKLFLRDHLIYQMMLNLNFWKFLKKPRLLLWNMIGNTYIHITVGHLQDGNLLSYLFAGIGSGVPFILCGFSLIHIWDLMPTSVFGFGFYLIHVLQASEEEELLGSGWVKKWTKKEKCNQLLLDKNLMLLEELSSIICCLCLFLMRLKLKFLKTIKLGNQQLNL